MKFIFQKMKFFIKKRLPFLSGLMLLSLALSLSFFYIEQQLTHLVASLIILTSLLFVVFVYISFNLNINDLKNRNNIQSLRVAQVRMFMRVLTIFMVSITFIGGSNYLAHNSDMRWDVTQAKQHTLSNNTIEFIRSLKSDIKLTAFYVGMPPKYLQDLFNEYQRVSAGLISSEIIDPIEQIAYAAKFGNVVSGKERKVIVQTNGSSKEVDFTDEYLSEEKLTHAIARAIRAPRQVYFLTGHNEYSILNKDNVGLSTFKKLLADNNIESKTLMLGITQSIPDDCDVLIIAGPQNELTPKEEKLIIEYLTKGGDALFLIENTLVTTADKPLTASQQDKNPALNNILNHWGLNVQSDIVVDLTNHVGDDVGSPATKNYPRHKAITEGLDYTFYVRPRSIRVLAQRRPTIKVAPIASTASKENSWAETDRTLNIKFDPAVDTAGPVPFAYVVLEERAAEEKTAKQKQENMTSNTRLIVFTDADFLTNIYINQYSNAQMGLNIVNWLAELEYKVFLSPKEIKVERLDLTSKQKRQVIVILFLLPFFFVIVGLIVWLRTKVHH
ncbi:GldG family protein [Colwellia piezophila]|uniref:GldG family protein n=1 Tax=Colwellia piezophila TaxID=211668 RepID=UPI00037CB14F|nr:GldG family protein [Colwellia piezophila]